MSDQLDILQQWMHTVITSGGSLQQQLGRAGEKYDIRVEDIVVAGRLPVETRLNVYTSGYVLRLLECMQADFPALYTFMGEQVFQLFARAYIFSYPSSSYTLFELSKDFPSFLAETKPSNHADEAMLDLPPELARLERARVEAMRSKGTEREGAFMPVDIFPFFGEETTISSPPCTRLLELKFPLLELYRQLQKGIRPPVPGYAKTFLVTGRKNYRLTMAEITEGQFCFLSCLNEPVSFYEAVANAAKRSGHPVDEMLADMYIWLPVAMENGWIEVQS